MHFLEELDGGPEMAAEAGAVLEFDSLFVTRSRAAPVKEVESPEFIEAAGYDRGFADAEAQTRKHYEARLRELQAEFGARLESERARWTGAVAAESAQLIRDEIHRCECAIGEEVARLLLPLLETELTRKSVEEMRDLVRQMLAETPDSHLRISGPGDLTEAMRAALGENGLHATVQESGSLELRVEIDQIVIESRISKWIERLREVMP